MQVKIIAGKLKGKKATLLREYAEVAFGVKWNFIDVKIGNYTLKMTPSMIEREG